MASRITTAQYRTLADLRYHIRRFQRDGDAVAHDAGFEPQQFLMLLAIRGLPEGNEATIRKLAERVVIKHQSAVELIDRMEEHGYVRRRRGRDDRRQVIVSVLPRGERLLEKVVKNRISELRSSGQQLVKVISSLLEHTRRELAGNRRTNSSGQRVRQKARGKLG